MTTANLAGRTLADLILEHDTERTHLPWIGDLGRPWPPEPLRFLGVRGVNILMGMADRREWRTDQTSFIGRLTHLNPGR